jgi:hypothetical protein
MRLSQALETAMHCVDLDIPVHLSGAPGIGKTDGMGGAARSRGYGFQAETLGTMESVDLRGLPGHDGNGGVVWSKPDFLVRLDKLAAEFSHTLVVFMIDEINANGASVQVPCMALIRERHLGPHYLPANVRIVTAGNRGSDRAAAQRMGTALANRLCHVEVDSPACVEGVKEWCAWGASNNVHPMMLAFMMLRGAPSGIPGQPGYQPGLLHHFDPSSPEPAFPSPRSNTEVAKACDKPKHVRRAIARGCSGEIFAAEFEGFAEIYASLPPILSILSNPNGAKVPGNDQPAAQYAVSMALGRAANPQNFAAVLTYMGRVGREFEIVTVTDALRRCPDLTDTPAFINWAARNGDVSF